MKTAVFTIVSKNYLHFGRNLLNSVRKHHPDWDQYLLLVDEVDGRFDPSKEPFKVIEVSQLNLPHYRKFLFRYNIFELNMALKPYMLDWVLKREEHYDNVFYFDSDIYLYDTLDEVFDAFNEGSMLVLTPHFTHFVEDGCTPGEIDILFSGLFNMGFFAVTRHRDTQDFVDWWKRKLEYGCVVDIPKGIFADQKWINMVPGYFESIKILRNVGYNAAYWNLSYRNIEKRDGKYFVNDDKLVFFHFSGFNPSEPEVISRHQNRFVFQDLNRDTQELYKQYAQNVIDSGQECKSWPYAFGKFYDGSDITDEMRSAYRNDQGLQDKCGEDPYKCSSLFNSSPENQITENISVVNNKSSAKEMIVHILRLIFRIIKPFLKIILPWTIRAKLRRIQHRLLHPPNRLVTGNIVGNAVTLRTGNVNPNFEKGINLIGYLRAETGVGQAARGLASAIDTTGMPFNTINLQNGSAVREQDASWESKEINSCKYGTNIFSVNADATVSVCLELFGNNLEGRYNIGYWAWELPEIPDEWLSSYKVLNEIWAPTNFVLDAVSRSSDIPVVKIPYAISMEVPEEINREYFKLPKDKFLFLSMYDANSFQVRKNPRGAFEAFKRAFSAQDCAVGLVLKVNNAHVCPEEVQKLKQDIAAFDNVYLIENTISRREVNGLLNCIDCFISLHRSEGFGLVLAEAMYLGKPVIATNWSGNIDFMNNSNSCPVNYELVRLGQDYGPYKAHQYWAEPDIDHAAYYMRKVYEDKAWAKRIALKGQETIKTDYSPERVGQLIQKRLELLGLVKKPERILYDVKIKNKLQHNRPKILHIIGNTFVGGSTQLVVDLIENLGHKYEMEIATQALPNNGVHKGMIIHPFRDICDVNEAVEFFKKNKPDLIHFHYWGGEWYELFLKALKYYPCKVVENINIPIEPYITKEVDHYVYVSEYAQKMFGHWPDNSSVIYPGSDFNHFKPVVRDVLPDAVGMVYRLDGDKVREDSIDVFIKLAQKRPQTLIYIVGDGVLYNTYVEKVNSANVSKNFIFTGYVHYNELPEIYDKFSIFVAPVWQESFGQVSPFAMSKEIVVAGYNVGALPEILGGTSTLGNSVDELVDIIINLLDNPDMIKSKGKQMRQRALENFSLEAMISDYDKLYEKILKNR